MRRARDRLRRCTSDSSSPRRRAPTTTTSCKPRSAERHGFGAFVRSDHYLGFGAARLPGPTDSWVTLAGLARETKRIQLGTLVSSATFRLPGPLAITVAQVDTIEWWPGAPRSGVRLERTRASRVRHSLPTVGRALRSSGRTASHHQGSLDDAGRCDVRLRRPPLPDQRVSCTSQADADPHPPIIVGGTGRETHAGSGGPLRRRIQPASVSGSRPDRGCVRSVPSAWNPWARSIYLGLSVTLTTVCGEDQAESNAVARFATPVRSSRPGRPAVADCRPPQRVRGAGCEPCVPANLDLRDLEHIELLGSHALPSCTASNI